MSSSFNIMIILTFLCIFSIFGANAFENTHDRILKANQDAKEEELAFGVNIQPLLMEGDIVADISGSTFDAINGKRWPNGVIPYVFGSVDGKGRKAIETAIRDYHEKTCLKFVRRRYERDYIVFNKKRGCYSHIGKQGGMQEVSIGEGCQYLSTAIHEIMHAIGFYHEQSRLDRDQHVTVNFHNIMDKMDYNFNKYSSWEASTLGEPYDTKSVMHYSKYAFSKNRRPTIVSKTDPNEELGNNIGFSSIDIRQINKYYSCNGTPNPNPPTKRPMPSNCKDRSPNCKWNMSKCNYKGYGQYWCQRSCGFC